MDATESNGSAAEPGAGTMVLDPWPTANQRSLASELARVRRRLEHYAARAEGHDREAMKREPDAVAPPHPADGHGAPPALNTLCTLFGLSPFERDVVVLCAGVEFDARFASLCAAAHGDAQRVYPTFGLALAALPGAHWSALSPEGPLRYWHLVEMGAGAGLTRRPLHIDERVLHYLAGVSFVDEHLADLIEPVQAVDDLVPSHRALAEQITALWSETLPGEGLPVVQLCGHEDGAKRVIAAMACGALGLRLMALDEAAMPTDPGGLRSLIRRWEREAALQGSALLLICGEHESDEALHTVATRRLLERTQGAILVACRERLHLPQRSTTVLEVDRPSLDEQMTLWEQALGAAAPALNGYVRQLASQFNLGLPAIRTAAAEARGRAVRAGEVVPDEHRLGAALWDACRRQVRPRLDDLAQRIEPVASWEDLVLPEAQRQLLREVAVHVRQRMKVYHTWNFVSKGKRGLGISALFAGASGTGKTMAAEVLAHELQLDLYRIDLSSVVSKYIGETEKNLRRIFDAADEGGMILLFDEADALFGKRSEVKDSHDRYANIEVGYLLQRMESYRGLAILTTNFRSALDSAFLRRIRFIVQFPFPDAAQRAEIWRRIFPAATPTEAIDMDKLARLNVAGGNIRNIAMNAAFPAADAGEPVRMAHLLQATRGEYLKLEKTLTEAEIAGWV